MKVLNLMLNRDLGGIQQAFLDYNDAFVMRKISVINVTSFFAKTNSKLHSFRLLNLGGWDFFSKLYLWWIIKKVSPDVVICHGGREVSLALFACRKSLLPLIGVAHDYNIAKLTKCDYIISLTEHMKQYLLQDQFSADKIAVIPNMIRMEKYQGYYRRDRNQHVIIGTMGKFVEKKGIDLFLHAISKLRTLGYDVRAVIGGDGEEQGNLKKLARKLSLEDDVIFLGWVNDSAHFLQNIDIFCLPSRHEPFGISLLEAMAMRLPIVSTSAEGPREILQDRSDSLLCSASSEEISKKLIELIDNPLACKKYADNAYFKLKELYDIHVVSQMLVKFISFVVNNKKNKI